MLLAEIYRGADNECFVQGFETIRDVPDVHCRLCEVRAQQVLSALIGTSIAVQRPSHQAILDRAVGTIELIEASRLLAQHSSSQ